MTPARKRVPIPPTSWPSAGEAAGSLLFSPGRLGPGCVTSSRTWVPAMVPWRALESGETTDDVVDWYARFARGRPGVLVVEATGIRDVPSGPLLRIGDDRFVAGLSRVVDAVREASGGATRLLIQLIDFLAVRRRPEPARFFARYLGVTDRHRAALAERTGDDAWRSADEADVRTALAALPESAWPDVLGARDVESLTRGYRERVTDLHLPHVADLPRMLPGLFAGAAGRAREAGFDGVELHYAHAYTMASFLSRLNDRDDGYGGTRDGRVRLPLEVYRAVRDEVGTDWTVGCRFLGDEVIDGGSDLHDAVWYGRRFAEAGMDFLSISKGGKFEDAKQPRIGAAVYPYTGESGHECMPTVFASAPGPFGRNVPLAATIRKAVRADGRDTPVVAAGGINSFELAESVLRNGSADFVAAARQSLADPDWWEKMRTGRGESIRRCVYTNYCEGLDQRHVEVTCQLWDRDFADEASGGETVKRTKDGRRRLTAP